MTCIAAIVSQGKVYMGGDSMVYDEERKFTSPVRKVYKLGSLLVGECGTVRASNVIRHTLPKGAYDFNGTVPLEHFIANVFVPELHEELYKQRTTEDTPRKLDGQLLIAYADELVKVYCDLSVTVNSGEYDAIGCGATVALGSLYSTSDRIVSPTTRIKEALRASEKHILGIGPPYYVLTTRKRE